MIINKAMTCTLVIIALALLTSLLFGCGFDPCGNEELKTINSPDGKRKAVVFKRDCGATTGFSTQITLLHINDKLPNEAGNTFIADTDDGKAPDEPGSGPEVKLQWVGERELIVRYDKRARVLRSERSVDSVRIRYERQ